MPSQLSGTTAVLVSETAAQNYYVGGPFSLGPGPFTDLTFDAEDDDTDFASFGAQYSETSGEGRQLGTLRDDQGLAYDDGLASLEDVLYLENPNTGEIILVGRVSIRVDNGQPGGGEELQDFYIFSAPIDPNVTYTITDIDYTPGADAASSHSYSTFSGGNVVCFLAGTLINTSVGPRPVESLHPGDLIQTADSGLRPLLWRGQRRISRGTLARSKQDLPIVFYPGTFGNTCPLLVSPQHRILVRDRFAKAKHLVEQCRGIARIAWGKRDIDYYHLLFEDHQVVFANGVPAESLFLGPVVQQFLTAGALGRAPNQMTGPRFPGCAVVPCGDGGSHSLQGLDGEITQAHSKSGLCRSILTRHEVADAVREHQMFMARRRTNAIGLAS